jgi:ArsR family transcriptional regulator
MQLKAQPLPSPTKSSTRRKPHAGGSNLKEQNENNRLASYCRALAHPVRVRAVKLLIKQHCMFGDIARSIPLAQSTISQHLKILTQAGLVDAEVVGQCTCYCINEGELSRLRRMFGDL